MSRVLRLTIVLVINLLVLGALVAVGLAAHSLGVLAEGGDYLADAAAIGVSLLAIWLSGRPPTARHPSGYPRATALAAMVNGGWLLVLNVVVVLGATWRLLTGVPQVRGLPVLVVSGVAAGLMLFGALLLRGTDNGERDVNMRAVLLDTAADAAAAAGVAATGAIILITGGWYWLDPTAALLIAVAIGFQATALLRDASKEVRHLNRVQHG